MNYSLQYENAVVNPPTNWRITSINSSQNPHIITAVRDNDQCKMIVEIYLMHAEVDITCPSRQHSFIGELIYSSPTSWFIQIQCEIDHEFRLEIQNINEE